MCDYCVCDLGAGDKTITDNSGARLENGLTPGKDGVGKRIIHRAIDGLDIRSTQQIIDTIKPMFCALL